MQILIQLPLPVLQAYVNQAILSLLAGTHSESELRGISGVEIRPVGELSLRGDGKDVIHSLLSIEVTAKIRTEGLPIPALIRSLSPWEEVRCSLQVDLQTQLYLGDDWELKASSHVSYEWIQKPRLGVGPVQISVSSVVHPFLDAELKQVAQEVDALITKQTSIPQIIQYSWQKLHQYQLVEEEEKVWLLARPTSSIIGLTPLSVGEEVIQIGAQLPLLPHVQMGKQAPNPDILQLPTWQSWGPFSPKITLPLSAHLPWSWLTRTLQKRDLSLTEAETRLNILPIEILPKNGQISALVGFEGKLQVGKKGRPVKGEILLTGSLQPDRSQLSATLSSFSFQLKKGNPLLHATALLFRRRIRKRLQEVCNALLKDLASFLFELIQKEVQSVPLDRGVQLYSMLNGYQLAVIQPETHGLQLSLTAEGESRLVIEEIPG